MSKKLEIPKPTTGYGYVGVWANGDIGWFLPGSVHNDCERRYPSKPSDEMARYADRGDRAFLCKITVVPVTDKRGRPVTRIVK